MRRLAIGLEHPEVDLDGDQHGHRFAVLRSGLELVAANRFDGFFIESHSKALNDARILRVAVSIHDDRDEADTLILAAARLVGELGLGSVDGNWRYDSVAWGINHAAIRARAIARA